MTGVVSESRRRQRRRTTIRNIFFLTIAYAIAALVGQALTVPPANASPIWPAAGVALASLLVGGTRLWPGIVLGSLLSNAVLFEHSGNTLVTAIFYGSFAIAATLQALCGAAVINSRRRGLAVSRESRIFLTLLLAGPLACLIGATWSVSTLWLAGAVPTELFLANWLLWWVGDSLGVLIVAPLMVLALPAGRRIWPERSLPVLFPLLAASALLVIAVHWFHDNEEEDARRPVQLQAELAYDITRERLRSASNAVLATGHYMATSEEVFEYEFQNFASRVREPGIRAIGWLPRVRADERAGYVESMRQSGYPGFDLWVMDGEGNKTSAPEKAEYFPVQYVDSAAGTRHTFGVDLSSHPLRREALQQARDTGKTVATAPLFLYPDGAVGVLLVMPVYENGAIGTDLDLAQRREQLAGVVTGVLDPSALIQALATAAQDQALAFTVRDTTLTDAPSNAMTIGDLPDDLSEPVLSREVNFFGRQWSLDAYPSARYWQPAQTTRSRVFLLAALLSIFVIAVHTLASAARNRAIETKVVARTREVSEHRRRLRSALSIASIGCWEHELASNEMTLDDKYLAILGTTARDEGGNRKDADTWMRRFLHPDDSDGLRRQVQDLIDSESPAPSTTAEVRVMRRDGEVRYLVAHFELERDGNGKPRRITGSTQDITERKQVEIELRNSKAQIERINTGLEEEIQRRNAELAANERELRQTFEAAAVGIAHTDYAGRYLRVNPRMTDITGYDEAELLTMSPWQLLIAEDQSDYQQLRDGLWDEEIPNGFSELRLQRKDGKIIWVSISLSAVRGPDGDIQYAMGIVEDISWRKEAQAELQQQQELNRLLLETLSEGVVACDADGKLMLFNKVAREWHGADLRRLPPEQWADHYDLYEADGKTPLAMENIPLLRAWRGERVINAEMCIVPKGQPSRVVLASGAPLLDSGGNKVGAVVVMHDVTERKRALNEIETAATELKAAYGTIERERASLTERVAERTAELTAANEELANAKEAAESASRAKSAFLAIMSHEIRTPMNGIVGMVEVLAQSQLSANERDAVSTIRDSSFSLLRIIDDILDFSKIEAGRLELEYVPTEIEDVVEGICDTLAPEALGKNVDLRLFADPQLPGSVITDPTRLRQLLYNLLGNAIKFSGGRDDIRGRVQVRVEPGADNNVTFRVIDNGIGIAPDAIPGLFTSFTQAEASTTRRFGGTGLGLTISKRLVELLNGRIEVESAPGKGSTFTVTLPLPPAETEDAAGDGDFEQVACLLQRVDDDDCDAWCTYLRHAGAEAMCVSDLAPGQVFGAGRCVVHVHQCAESIERCDTQKYSDEDDVRHVIIASGARRNARIVAPHVVAMQGTVVRRRELLHAVAIAAGRASPDVLEGDSQGIAQGQLVAPSVSQARADGRLILVAEDDPINQKVILRQLDLLGYAGDVASNGAEALDMWQKDNYGLLLTDLHMPVMDGYELVKRIRSLAPDTHFPIIALTANALRGEADRASSAGFDAYLTKPLQLSDLGDVLLTSLPDPRSEPVDQAQSSATDGDRLLNLDTLRDIVGEDDGIVFEFLAEFNKSSLPLLDELRQAMARGDASRVAILAHRQKGAARAVGAARLGDLCAELENAARAENFGIVFSLVAQFELLSARVAAEIDEILQPADGSERRIV